MDAALSIGAAPPAAVPTGAPPVEDAGFADALLRSLGAVAEVMPVEASPAAAPVVPPGPQSAASPVTTVMAEVLPCPAASPATPAAVTIPDTANPPEVVVPMRDETRPERSTTEARVPVDHAPPPAPLPVAAPAPEAAATVAPGPAPDQPSQPRVAARPVRPSLTAKDPAPSEDEEPEGAPVSAGAALVSPIPVSVTPPPNAPAGAPKPMPTGMSPPAARRPPIAEPMVPVEPAEAAAAPESPSPPSFAQALPKEVGALSPIEVRTSGQAAAPIPTLEPAMLQPAPRTNTIETAPVASPTTAPPPSPPARQVSSVAVALAFSPGTSAGFSLSLEPAELGRVEIRVQREGDSHSIRVTAERPETLALLQRDRHELDRGLAEAGLRVDQAGISFSLDTPGQGSRFGEDSAPGHRGAPPGAPTRPAQQGGEAPAPPRVLRSLLDLNI